MQAAVQMCCWSERLARWSRDWAFKSLLARRVFCFITFRVFRNLRRVKGGYLDCWGSCVCFFLVYQVTQCGNVWPRPNGAACWACWWIARPLSAGVGAPIPWSTTSTRAWLHDFDSTDCALSWSWMKLADFKRWPNSNKIKQEASAT